MHFGDVDLCGDLDIRSRSLNIVYMLAENEMHLPTKNEVNFTNGIRGVM